MLALPEEERYIKWSRLSRRNSVMLTILAKREQTNMNLMQEIGKI